MFQAIIGNLYARTNMVNDMQTNMERQQVYCFHDRTPGPGYTKIKTDGRPRGPNRQEPKPDDPTEPTEPERTIESSIN